MESSIKILIGSYNKQKAGYIKGMLVEKGVSEENIICGWELPLPEYDIPETGSSYYENSLIKGEAWVKFVNKNKNILPCIDIVISDDSGIELLDVNDILGIKTKREYFEYLKDNPEATMGEFIAFCSKEKGVDDAVAVFALTFSNVKTNKHILMERRWAGKVTQEAHILKGMGFDSHFKPNDKMYNKDKGMWTRDMFTLEDLIYINKR